jgi:hypothetical protein
MMTPSARTMPMIVFMLTEKPLLSTQDTTKNVRTPVGSSNPEHHPLRPATAKPSKNQPEKARHIVPLPRQIPKSGLQSTKPRESP